MTASATDYLAPARRGTTARAIATHNRLVWLALPATLVFVIFFVVPIALLLIISFNPATTGSMAFTIDFTLKNFQRIIQRPQYYEAIIRSVFLAGASALVALVLGYPLAYLVAKERRPGRANLYMILILIAMQLDLVIRMYGMIVLMGDAGLINDTLTRYGVISHPIPLMYNTFGVVVGLVQLGLPFMILSLIGVIQGINPAVEDAARSLGAGPWRTFFTITFPLSMPGVLAGSLLVFAIAVGSYAVPVLMGGFHVTVTPMQIYQQISEMGAWQFGAALATLLFAISLIAVFIYHRMTQRSIGGLV
jgi:putative spermidine/putrescine transport system permease protein